MESSSQLLKANDWLNARIKEWIPVGVIRNGIAQFIGYIYIMRRVYKPDVWYCMTMENYKIRDIKRICV